MFRFEFWGIKLECDTGAEACDLVLAVTKDDLNRKLFMALNQAIDKVLARNRELEVEVSSLQKGLALRETEAGKLE